METSNETRLSSIEVVQVSDNTFALECNNKLYYIGAVLFRVIQYVKAGKEFPEIQELIAAEYKLALSRERFDQILDDTLDKIISTASSETANKQSYVYGQVKLIGEQTLVVLTGYLNFLFRKAVGLPLLLLSLAVTGLFLLRLDQANLLHKAIPARHGVAMILGGYLFFIVVGLFHELGHATAAARHNIRPKEVGFGFYLVLPVLYTDVSKVWVLSKAKRILVNVAGIYFQLLINLVLYAAYEISLLNGGAAKYIIISFFLTNATLALYSLNPFFRNDGYWIFSDLFAIPNLSTAAQNYPVKCWQYLRGTLDRVSFREPGLALPNELALLAYSIGRLTMISWFSYMGYSGFYHSFQETALRISHQGQYANETFFERTFYLLKVVLFLVLFMILIYRTLKPPTLRLIERLNRLRSGQPEVAVAA